MMTTQLYLRKTKSGKIILVNNEDKIIDGVIEINVTQSYDRPAEVVVRFISLNDFNDMFFDLKTVHDDIR